MGLLEEILSLAGGTGAQQSQHATALSAIIDYINSPQVGGLAGLQSMFQQGGLGHIMSSWIGNGQNLPISASQLQSVLQSGLFEQIAQQAGLDPTQLSAMMSHLLPHFVDKLSPDGQLPDANSLGQMVKSLAAGRS